MFFNSSGFLLFFLAVLAFYYLPFSWRQKKVMLLVASYIFYGLWNPPLVLLLLASTVVDWIAGNQLYRIKDDRNRKWWIFLSLAVNLGFLGFFKYGEFLMENFTWLVNQVGWDYQAPAWDIILPMGISFYTFQTLSYSLDLYYRKIQPARTFLDFALYVTFFPQLVAGPIVRSEELVGQFYEPKRATWNQFSWGIFLLTLGLFEKTVLADSLLASTAEKVFNTGSGMLPLDAWTGVLAFSGQIFFDFAGYSLCAIGIAHTLGMELPLNFRFPYAATGFSDFWRRWHITLSTWLRDYLYIPLGGNRSGLVRTYINLMLTMLLGGLWHGAAWTFIVWGGLHGLYLSVERFMRSRKLLLRESILTALGTFFFVNITWVFFRAEDFKSAGDMLKSMFFLAENGKAVLETSYLLVVWIVIALLFAGHWIFRHSNLETIASKVPWWVLGGIWGFMLFATLISQASGAQFIYFQF
ncbi:MAG: MBOAT family protein [Saprospirales bacterium]|nr:MBOAT family protein [Saprospirales bacterium]